MFTFRSLPSQPNLSDAVQDQSKNVPASGATTNTPTQPAWNPFDDDNFSNLTAEEFTSDAKKANGNICMLMFMCNIFKIG